jgi:hypothetical protein
VISFSPHQPVSSEPYLRNQRSSFRELSWVIRLEFPIGLLFSEDPIGRFGQMAGHGADSLLVTRAPFVASTKAHLR